MKCRCPEGYPAHVIYKAKWPALVDELPVPKAVVLGHTGDCPLPDEILRIETDKDA